MFKKNYPSNNLQYKKGSGGILIWNAQSLSHHIRILLEKYKQFEEFGNKVQ